MDGLDDIVDNVLGYTNPYNKELRHLALHGSHLRNMNHDESDSDLFAIYDTPISTYVGLEKFKDTLPTLKLEGVDIHFIDSQKFFTMASKSNLTAFEICHGSILYNSNFLMPSVESFSQVSLGYQFHSVVTDFLRKFRLSSDYIGEGIDNSRKYKTKIIAYAICNYAYLGALLDDNFDGFDIEKYTGYLLPNHQHVLSCQQNNEQYPDNLTMVAHRLTTELKDYYSMLNDLPSSNSLEECNRLFLKNLGM